MKAFGLTNRKIYKHLGGGLYCGKKNNFSKTTEKGKKSTKVSFIPFLVFGHFWRRSYKNMRILHNLFLHFARQAGQVGKKWKENHATKVTKIPKYQKMKILDERNTKRQIYLPRMSLIKVKIKLAHLSFSKNLFR